MSSALQMINRVRGSATIRQIVIALLITGVLFAYSNYAPEYLKIAVKANLEGLVFILYSLWLALIVLWFKAWQLIFHASTSSS